MAQLVELHGAELVYWRTLEGPWHRSLELPNGERLTAERCQRDQAGAMHESNSLAMVLEDPRRHCSRCWPDE